MFVVILTVYIVFIRLLKLLALHVVAVDVTKISNYVFFYYLKIFNQGKVFLKSKKISFLDKWIYVSIVISTWLHVRRIDVYTT